MFEILLQLNPLVYVAIALLLIAFLALVLLKSKKKKNSKVEKVFPSKSKDETLKTDEAKVEEPETLIKEEPEKDIDENIETHADVEETDKVTQISVDKDSTVKEKKKIKIFKEKLKPSVEKVYVREKKDGEDVVKDLEVTPQISEEELLEKMQFVKSSKKVSKLRTLSEEELLAKKQADEQLVSETSESENIVFEDDSHKSKYFDRSRRLSRCIECGSIDEMFCPHLSDKYLNINADRFIKTDEEMVNALYNRTSQMLANSGIKTMNNFNDEEDEENSSPLKMFKNDRDYMKDWMEKRRREEMAKFIIDSPNAANNSVVEEDEPDDINLSAKTLLVVDSILKRKSSKKV